MIVPRLASSVTGDFTDEGFSRVPTSFVPYLRKQVRLRALRQVVAMVVYVVVLSSIGSPGLSMRTGFGADGGGSAS
jgi:hypothetical protein